MNTDHVDILARSLTIAGSRRGALVAALGGMLGTVLGVTPGTDAKKKKPCPPCKKRKKGKCKKTLPDGTTCENGGTCQGGNCVTATIPSVIPPVPSAACGAGGPCRVFLSSSTHDGNFGGLGGADAICQGLAAAAGLSGTYKAWLSDSTSSPSSRFVRSTGPYQLVNGTTIATSWTDLTDGTLLAPINVTETGGGIGATNVTWTHTTTDGNAGGAFDVHCQNWSTRAQAIDGDDGQATDSRDDGWTRAGSSTCNSLNHFYCFQQR